MNKVQADAVCRCSLSGGLVLTMNEFWPMDVPLGIHPSVLTNWVLAQAVPAQVVDVTTSGTSFLNGLLVKLGPVLISLAGALGILIVGWIVASVVSGLVRRLLKMTNIDNRLAGWASGSMNLGDGIETLVSTVVYWIIMILAVVAALNVLKLETVSQPLNNFLNQIFAYLPKLGSAAVLMAVAWLVATLVRTLVFRAAQSFKLDERVQLIDGEVGAQGQPILSSTLGNALYGLVFLFFLPLILGVLELTGPLQPIQNLLDEILAALPKILKAILIGGVGWLAARTVRDIVSNLLATTGLDQVGARAGLSRQSGSQPLSWLVGNFVFVLILIPTATAALDALQIPAVSGPASAMLNQVLSTIPQVITAGVILAIAFFVSQFVAELVSNLLAGIGFNNLFQWLGLQATPTVLDAETQSLFAELESGTPPAPQEPVGSTAKTPSEMAGLVVTVGIMLFATVAATQVLNIPALTQIVSGLLVIAGQILAGVVVFAIGLYLANLAFNLIVSSGTHQSRMLGQAARIAILVLVGAMALQQMGIATSIVNLAFGLLLGAIAVAIAIAFGLGGRDIASEQIREWLSGFNQK